MIQEDEDEWVDVDDEEAEAVRELAERVLEMTTEDTWDAQVFMSISVIHCHSSQ